MYYHYPYFPNVNPYLQPPYPGRAYPTYPSYVDRQQPVKGQATWTEGGQVTKCELPWSTNDYMTAAVGEDSPYQCGQTLKIRNLSVPDTNEITVTIVDQVMGYPPNRINLHRKAFEALGATLDMGVIDVEIIPENEEEREKWGRYLLSITQMAYPGYQVMDYRSIGKTQVYSTQTKETYSFVLQSPQEQVNVRGHIIYHQKTGRVISFEIKEV